MTERLYYTDAYLTNFDARIVERRADGLRLYLDRTALYPTSGGQPHDRGTIAGVSVDDVIDEGDRIAHVVTSPIAADAVRGEVDWERRFDFMQQHTGQHLLSALFADGLGAQTVSVHFGPESSTLDLDREEVEERSLLEIERHANQVVGENRSVGVSFEEANSAQDLRKVAPREGTIRVISIDGIDRSACGGTHVRGTSEIGTILLRRKEKVRKTTRIEFVCGLRALRMARRDFAALSMIAQQLSASSDDAPALVSAQSEQLREALNRVRRLESEAQTYRAKARYEAVVPDANGVRVVIERHAAGTPDDWRAFALAYCALPRTLFCAITESPPAILVAASDDAGIDAGKSLKAALAEAGGRGGGSPRMAQGSVPTAEALPAVLRTLGIS